MKITDKNLENENVDVNEDVREHEPEVITVESVDADDTVENNIDEDSLRRRIEEKYGDKYTVDKIVVDGNVINFVGVRKGDDVSVAIRVED